VITTLNKVCEISNIEDKTKEDIVKIAKVIVEQNSIHFQDTIYVKDEGLAMGAPTSSIFSEIYLQYIENTKIFKLLLRHKFEGYFRYVDDILIMYKEDRTSLHNVLDDFSSLILIMKFTLEKKENNKINFLDITIAKDHDGISFEIYRKPKTTDVIIPNDSCHARENKTAAIRYFCNRMKTYKLTPESLQKKTRYSKSCLTTITMLLP
jgi:hypothetical protein